MQLETSLRSAEIAERIRRFELDAGIIYPDRQNTADLLVTPLYAEQQVLIAGTELLTGQSAPSAGWAHSNYRCACCTRVGCGHREID